jgi:hypothetical protein
LLAWSKYELIIQLIEFEIWNFVDFSMKILFNNSYIHYETISMHSYWLIEGFPIVLSAQMDPYSSSVFELYQVCNKGNEMSF